MKKTISILLIVTMLLSMLVVAIPAGAAEPEANSVESVFVSKWTGEHKSEQQLESETGADFTVITNYAEFDAITSGTASAIKYYCVILPAGTETLVMSGKTHLDGTNLEYIYIDFNGYTVDVSGINNGLFNTITRSTIKNLKLVGDMYIRSSSWTGAGYNYVCEEVGMSPISTGHITSGSTTSVITLDNIVSEVNMVVSAQHGGGKLFAGIIPQTSGGSVVKNCEFKGNITVETDTANSKVGTAQVGCLGGITAQATNTTFENCRTAGSITLDDNMFFGTDGNNGPHIGGIAGKALSANTVFKNCENGIDITINAFARATASADDKTVVPANIGGIAGSANAAIPFTNCANLGDITVTAGQNRVGGILGGALANGITVTSCTNSGAICYTSGGATDGTFGDHKIGMGGIVGVLNAAVTVKNCDNVGTVTVTNSASFGGGAFGAGGVVGTVAVASDIVGCTNNAKITYDANRNSNAEAAGGIIGKIQTESSDVTTVTNCENKANGEIYCYATQNGGDVKLGGIIGYVKYSAATVTNCVNNGTVKNNFYSNAGAGGIVGYTQQNTGYYANKLIIKKCQNNGLITISREDNLCRTAVGGILGNSYAPGPIEILECVNTGNILGDTSSRTYSADQNAWSGAGGIMGCYDSATGESYLVINNCSNSGSVRGAMGVGGILGTISRCKDAEINVDNCSNTGAVSCIAGNSKYTALGGIVGIVNDTSKGAITLNVTECVNKGAVSATFNYVGGIVGGAQLNVKPNDNSALSGSNANDVINITDCLNAGALTCGTNSAHPRTIGGIAGNTAVGTYVITGCINIGNVTGGDAEERGAIVGRNGNVTVTDTYYYSAVFSGEASNTYGETLGDEEILIAVEEINLLVNKKAFRELINAINSDEFPGEEKYTVVSLAPLYAAVEKAMPINDIPVFTIVNGVVDFSNVEGLQAQVDAAYAEMVAAQKNLKINLTAYNEINDAILAAEGLYESEESYTAQSWKNFIDAINVAKAVLDDPANLIAPAAAIADLQAAVDALELGGNIYNIADFERLNGQYGNFYLMNDITISAPVENFYGNLYGNGYTVTLNGCAMFLNVGDAESSVEIVDLKIVGDAGDAKSLFGKANGEVTVDGIYVGALSFTDAVFFDDADDAAEIYVYEVISLADAGIGAFVGDVLCFVEIWTALAMGDAPALAGTVALDSEFIAAYLNGVVYYDVNGNEYTAAEDFASGMVAYGINADFAEYGPYAVAELNNNNLLLQNIGTDALPYQGRLLADGRNVVVAIMDGEEIIGYENAGKTYTDEVPALPDDEETVEIDYTALNKAIADAEALDASKYTDASWATVKAFLASAKAALALTRQSAVDVATSSLNSAIAALVEKEVVAAIDYAALNATIAKAEALKGSDYSAGTWATLQTMLAMAKMAQTATTQAEVDQANVALESAIDSLKAPAATDAPTEAPKATEPAEESGCGSIVSGAAVVLAAVAALGCGISFKKRED